MQLGKGMMSLQPVRNLVLVLGDQLDRDSAALDGFDPTLDRIWMAEVVEESTHVQSHKVRTALFLSAMRHFREELQAKGWPVEYRMLSDSPDCNSLGDALQESVTRLNPEGLLLVRPGSYRVLAMLESVAEEAGYELELRPDRHFLCSMEGFARHVEGRKQLRMEYFYREMRKKHDVLMDGGKPVGGVWNFDKENRGSFGKDGPKSVPRPISFVPDSTTMAVLEEVEALFPDHVGDLSTFNWPVTPEQAQRALEGFIEVRLPSFGLCQDAMWTEEPFLWHSLLSTSLNLKLLHPGAVISAVEAAYREAPDRYPLPAVEGFIRQVLGWREYVRGVYWHFMPEYVERNVLEASQALPGFYWTGKTDMACMEDALGQTLKYGYAHHIQRLMVTGLFSLLYGVDPKEIHRWYLAVYVDAVEWVELPNTLGMSQFADGGVMASKPYTASGNYIHKMSNYCRSCRFHPKEATGDKACPFTTLYWDFLIRHEDVLRSNQRMVFQLRNLDRLGDERKREIRTQADTIRTNMA